MWKGRHRAGSGRAWGPKARLRDWASSHVRSVSELEEGGWTYQSSRRFASHGAQGCGKARVRGSPPAPAFLSGTRGTHVPTGHLCFGPRAVVLVSSADRTQSHHRGQDCCVFSEHTSRHPPKKPAKHRIGSLDLGNQVVPNKIKSALKNQQKVKV